MAAATACGKVRFAGGNCRVRESLAQKSGRRLTDFGGKEESKRLHLALEVLELEARGKQKAIREHKCITY